MTHNKGEGLMLAVPPCLPVYAKKNPAIMRDSIKSTNAHYRVLRLTLTYSCAITGRTRLGLLAFQLTALECNSPTTRRGYSVSIKAFNYDNYTRYVNRSFSNTFFTLVKSASFTRSSGLCEVLASPGPNVNAVHCQARENKAAS